ncbi:MAG: TetR/AcrR family transcriptional regulator [Deltaproteobacteria bacterium]|nr:TetR/AcrR family transcriptional regulator [Deltaproteobacteria bacterium]
MTKGEDTKQIILKAGLGMASQVGLESVTIGNLANATNMSKSGLFAHFQSKEKLQIEILNYAAQLFAEEVVRPSLRTEAGIPRIRALVDNWVSWASKQKGSCIFVSASTEFSDRHGKVRECLLRQQEEWISTLSRIARSAIKAGDFMEGIDCEQFAFDLFSLLLGFHYYHKLLQDSETQKHQNNALDRLLDDFRLSITMTDHP